MTTKYQNRTVTVVRTLKQGDPGFDPNKDQVVINDGGTEKTVLRNEVTDSK